MVPRTPLQAVLATAGPSRGVFAMQGDLHLRDGRIEYRWRRWRNKKRQEMSSCLMVLLSGAILLGGGGIAEAGPTGGQITAARAASPMAAIRQRSISRAR